VFNDDHENRPVYRNTIGMDLPVKIGGRSDMQFIAEYFYNSEGFTPQEAWYFNRRMEQHRYYSRAQGYAFPMMLPRDFTRFGTFSRHYFCAGITGIEIIGNRVWAGMVTIGNIEPRLVIFRPQLNFKIDNIVFIDIYYSYMARFRDTEAYLSEYSYSNINNSLALFVNASF
jgi:hypothetical protein